jgi:uncharacterized hydrophobic protein (TIGR00341 family)
MPLRLIEIIIPSEDRQAIEAALSEKGPDEGLVFWVTPLADKRLCVKIILEMEESEDVLDAAQKRLSFEDEYRMVVYPVEATLPRLSSKEKDKAKKEKEKKKKDRRSREELYTAVTDVSEPKTTYFVLVLLSTIVVVVGLLNDNAAVIIGAMVIAPLLGPNVGLALAAALGDGVLARRAAFSLLSAGAFVYLVTWAIGSIVAFNPELKEVAARTRVDFSDMVLALAAGSAGILAFTAGAPAGVIGVMVALALLPPLAVSGLCFGAGLYHAAANAALLCLINIICLNLAGVATFVAQGVSPGTWWEQKKAKVSIRYATAIWAILLGALSALLVFGNVEIPVLPFPSQ